MKKMIFTLSRDGTSTVDVEGAVGDECLELTKAFEEELGELTTRTFNESYSEEGRVSTNVHDRNNA
jgi:hypothetical protein